MVHSYSITASMTFHLFVLELKPSFGQMTDDVLLVHGRAKAHQCNGSGHNMPERVLYLLNMCVGALYNSWLMGVTNLTKNGPSVLQLEWKSSAPKRCIHPQNRFMLSM